MRTRHRWLPLSMTATLIACGGGSGSTPAPTAPTPPAPPPALSVTTQAVFASLTFSQPVGLLQAPADSSRWYALEKAGVIRVFDNDPQVASSAVFADLTMRVDASASESGLLGMAFHPDFDVNGEVFISYTRSGSPLESVISRFRSLDNGVTLAVASEEILLTVLQDFSNHNGGHIAFGDDGYLYAGFGDGGSANDPNNRAQDETTLLGKMLRIDIDQGAPYGIPAGNPFAGNATCVQGFGGASCPEIFALGLRNPWRFSFDRQTGELWVGDVGQGSFEEIDRVVAGGNYGWRIREGAHCNIPASGCDTTGLDDPVTEYDHNAGISVTGGFVYRGTNITALQGRYVFGDFGSGRVWSIVTAAPIGSDAEELFDSSFNIASFAQGNDGELFLVDFGAGTLHQLIDDS